MSDRSATELATGVVPSEQSPDTDPSGPSRRAVLVAIAGGALFVGGGGLAFALSRRSAETNSPNGVADDGVVRDGVVRVGRRYLRDHPDEDRASLHRDLPEVAETGQLAALADRVAADFAEGRVVELDGWVLSVTEARAAALIALTHS